MAKETRYNVRYEIGGNRHDVEVVVDNGSLRMTATPHTVLGAVDRVMIANVAGLIPLANRSDALEEAYKLDRQMDPSRC